MESDLPTNRIDITYTVLQELCENNQEHFKQYIDDEYSQRLYLGFQVILDNLKVLVPALNEFRKIAHEYDYDGVHANGYRSFILLTDKFVGICINVCKKISIHRGSLFFKKSHYTKDIEVSGQIFASLSSCFSLLTFLRDCSAPGNSFLEDRTKIKSLLTYVDKINLYCFYGRFIGFQFCDSMKPIIKSISVMMATYGAVYNSDSSSLLAWTSAYKKMIYPEARANNIVQMSDYRTVPIHFFKMFFHLSESELLKIASSIFESNAVNKLIPVPFKPIQCTNLDGSVVDIPCPTSPLNKSEIFIRLISSKRRTGMDLDGKYPTESASSKIILHCHGGGFVSQTSTSHESYLKEWSCWLDVPIISVDYSLAPESPYPRALEEILYVYAWLLNNASTLGTTAEKIVLAGDSAGANLCLSLALKCISLNIRIPDGLFLAYLPVVCSITPTPARMLCLTDPLMTFGFMVACLKAYTNSTININSMVSSNDSQLNATATNESSEAVIEGSNATEKSNSAHLNDNEELVNKIRRASSSEEDKVLFDIHDTPEEDVVTLPLKFKKVTENFITTLTEKVAKLTSGSLIYGNTINTVRYSYESEPLEKFVDEVPQDMFLSPYLADDQSLKQLPPISILTVQLDPCLDDCVMLAKKLSTLGVQVTFDVLNGIPHGFLNLSNMSKEAKDGSMSCARRIKELLEGTK